jgi:hypothetical protein
MPELYISESCSTPGWEDDFHVEEDVDECEEDSFEDQTGYFD